MTMDRRYEAERDEVPEMRHVEENEPRQRNSRWLFTFSRGNGEGKRQSYEKPGFIAYEGRILVHRIEDCLDP